MSETTTQRPLGEVLARAYGWEFEPRDPTRPPWAQPSLRGVEHAYTGNVAVVPLERADRVQLHNLDRPSDERDDLEPFDWTPAGWGVS